MNTSIALWLSIFIVGNPKFIYMFIFLEKHSRRSPKGINKMKQSKCERMLLFETASLNQSCLSFYQGNFTFSIEGRPTVIFPP